LLVAGILRDIDCGWHWKSRVVKLPRQERWTLYGRAATEDDARAAVEMMWGQLCGA
jgi:hypothetical protein